MRHTYPFCWRCESPLLYYAKPSWYIRTTREREGLLAGNARVNWQPAHIQRGRFGNWLEQNIDWAVSRERYWGTPLPFWECAGCGATTVVGSRAELADRAMDRAAAETLDDLHRPFIDAIALRCDAEGCGGEMRRVPEVADAWFDSGAMPYAQWHYPFEHGDEFRRQFPADFICEAIDQTRGWFYTLHAEASLLGVAGAVPETIAYRNVVCHGHILDERGDKMSKSRGNVVEPFDLLDELGADAVRWYIYASAPVGASRRFSARLVNEGLRRFQLTLWNVYRFLVGYANADGIDPRQRPDGAPPVLDRWLLSELQRPHRARHGGPRPLRPDRRRARHRGLHGRPLQLVRAPLAPPLLARAFRRRRGQAPRLFHAARDARGAGEAARALHALPRRGAVAQPRAVARRRRAGERAPGGLARSRAPRIGRRRFRGRGAERGDAAGQAHRLAGARGACEGGPARAPAPRRGAGEAARARRRRGPRAQRGPAAGRAEREGAHAAGGRVRRGRIRGEAQPARARPAAGARAGGRARRPCRHGRGANWPPPCARGAP